jgi:uncharacterized membrane protein
MIRAAQGANTEDVCLIAAIGSAIAALALTLFALWFVHSMVRTFREIETRQNRSAR